MTATTGHAFNGRPHSASHTRARVLSRFDTSVRQPVHPCVPRPLWLVGCRPSTPPCRPCHLHTPTHLSLNLGKGTSEGQARPRGGGAHAGGSAGRAGVVVLTACVHLQAPNRPCMARPRPAGARAGRCVCVGGGAPSYSQQLTNALPCPAAGSKTGLLASHARMAHAAAACCCNVIGHDTTAL